MHLIICLGPIPQQVNNFCFQFGTSARYRAVVWTVRMSRNDIRDIKTLCQKWSWEQDSHLRCFPEGGGFTGRCLRYSTSSHVLYFLHFYFHNYQFVYDNLDKEFANFLMNYFQDFQSCYNGNNIFIYYSLKYIILKSVGRYHEFEYKIDQRRSRLRMQLEGDQQSSHAAEPISHATSRNHIDS